MWFLYGRIFIWVWVGFGTIGVKGFLRIIVWVYLMLELREGLEFLGAFLVDFLCDVAYFFTKIGMCY